MNEVMQAKKINNKINFENTNEISRLTLVGTLLSLFKAVVYI